jgi:hypothetical protein
MSKKKSSQLKLLDEMRNQLMVQAERLGIRDRYTPLYMLELDIDSCKKLLSELYSERSNLEYEMNMFGTNKKELLIKMERLNSYIRKAEKLQETYAAKLEKQLGKSMGDRKQVGRVLNRLNPTNIRAAA